MSKSPPEASRPTSKVEHVQLLSVSKTSGELYLFKLRTEIIMKLRDFFPVLWEHDPYPWNWELQQCFFKNWEKIQD